MPTTLRFEGIAPEGSDATMPTGHGGFRWHNAQVADATAAGVADSTGFESAGDYDRSGFVPLVAAASARSAAANLDTGAMAFASAGHDHFALLSGWFASVWNDGLRVKVVGVRDGEQVAAHRLRMDQDMPEFVLFDAAFGDLDRVVIRTRGGTDADALDDGAGAVVGLDDLTMGGTGDSPFG